VNDTEISKEELIAELELLKAYKKNMSFVLDNIKEMFYKLILFEAAKLLNPVQRSLILLIFIQ